MFCPRCGCSLPESATFCGRCGCRIPSKTLPNKSLPTQSLPAERVVPSAGFSQEQQDAAKLVRVIIGLLIVVFMFRPWLHVSLDSLIDASNNAQQQALGTVEVSIPKMGGLGLSVTGIGDTIGNAARLKGWMEKAAAFLGSSITDFEGLEQFGNLGLIALFYRLFEMLWIAGIVFETSGIAISMYTDEKNNITMLGSLLCAVSALIGIIVISVATGKLNEHMADLLGTSGVLLSLPQGSIDAFHISIAPVIVFALSILSIVLTMNSQNRIS